MLSNLEVADAEREIDRVDVFERWGKRDEVRQEDDGCDRSGERPGGRGAQRGFSRSAALRLPSR
jgi:hypothetical protein